jgi:hypothetical protein
MLRQRIRETPFLQTLYAFEDTTMGILDAADAFIGPPPGRRRYAAADSTARPKLHFKGFLYVAREPWERLVRHPVMGLGMAMYLGELGRQIRNEPSAMSDSLQNLGARRINQIIENLPLGERSRWAFYLMIGSANENYRSMLMDGEAMVLVSNWTTLYALPDLVLLTGTATWIEEQSELDRLLPPRGKLTRALGRALRLGL